MTRPQILDSTRNLIKLFRYHIGDSEVPQEYFLWAGISMVAAAVGDRVWLEKFKGKKLVPNLYITLIGPSAIGKGEAIDAAVRFVKDNARVNVYAGEATAEYLLKRMGQSRRTDDGKLVLSNAKMYLVTPELSMSMPKGEQADRLIKHLTEMYTGRDYPFRKGTVTGGTEVLLKDYCINWLAGSTLQWLSESVPETSISGGFFGRMVAVVANYDLDKRICRPAVPHDYDAVVDEIMQRVEILSHVEGELRMTAEAREVEDKWYNDRPTPNEESLIPAWKREHDLMLKIAMVLALAEDGEPMVRRQHVHGAQQLSKVTQQAMPALVAYARRRPDTMLMQVAIEHLRRVKQVPHTSFLKWLTQQGGDSDKCRTIIGTLIESRQLTRIDSPRGRMYTWNGKRRLPSE